MDPQTSPLKDLPTGAFGENKKAVSYLFSRPEAEQQQLAEDYLAYLFDSAADPTSASSNQACLNLCYFVQQCRTSKSPNLRALSFSVCWELWNFYLEWSGRHHSKVMKQVLDLSAVLLPSNPDIKARILQRIATIISHKAFQPMVKPALKAAEVFITKKSVSSLEFLNCYLYEVSRGSFERYDSPEPRNYEVLVSGVFHWMRYADVSPVAGKLLVSLFLDLRKTSASLQHASLWHTWISQALLDSPDSLDNIKNHLFLTLFTKDRSESVKLLQLLKNQTDFSSAGHVDMNATLLLAAMEIGKKSDLVRDYNSLDFQEGRKEKHDQILLPEKAIGDFLTHMSTSIRSAALAVLVTSTSDNRPFTEQTLSFLKHQLGFLHSDTDAEFRNKLLSSTKNMLRRLDCVIRHLSIRISDQKRSSEKNRKAAPPPSSDVQTVLDNHQKFKTWYLEFLLDELIPTASFQRHTTALRAIMSLPEMSTTYDHSLQLQTESHPYPTYLGYSINELVLDLLADPFEEVRTSSSMILKTICLNPVIYQTLNGNPQPSESWESSVMAEYKRKYTLDTGLIIEFIANAGKAYRRTGREDLADGIARAWELLDCLDYAHGDGQKYLSPLVSRLEGEILKAQENLASAVRGCPVHGEFTALRLIVERLSEDKLILKSRWDGIPQRLIRCCADMWEVVEEVLCIDNPGSLPDSYRDIDIQDLLSFSFRAILESSNLMCAMVSNMNLQIADGSSFLNQEQFEDIGNLSFRQLASLRHRGAFSAVSLTFAKCCQQTQRLSLSILEKNAILQKWYQGSLHCIFDQVSTTRRSAGIPDLITGILSANAVSPSFESIMNEMQDLARRPVQLSGTDETNLPQVHAMNTLKEIYKSSVLSKKSELYIATGFQLAVESLETRIWAIRNCGLLLLRSLIDRMFGTNESKADTDAGWDGVSIKLSYDKYGSLPDLLLKLLDVQTDTSLSMNENNDGAVEAVFFALDIIRRAGPPAQYRHQIFNLVYRHLGSRVWHVRDIAARTMCTLVASGDWALRTMELLTSCHESSNRCHGSLMTFKYVLERVEERKMAVDADEFVSLILHIIDLQQKRAVRRGSPDVRAAYVEVACAILKISSNSSSESLHLEPIQRLIDCSNELARESLIPREEVSFHDLPKNSALCRKACGLLIVLATMMRKDIPRLREFVEAVVEKDPDTACAMLEAIPEAIPFVWSPINIETREALSGLFGAIVLKKTTISAQVQSIAFRNLAAMLEEYRITGTDFNNQDGLQVLALTSIIDTCQDNPEFANARLRLSGSLLIDFYLHEEISQLSKAGSTDETRRLETSLIEWGKMLSDAGNANNDFDTRYAAVESLNAFYRRFYEAKRYYIPNVEAVPSLLPSLLALYDALVDDDDEVRDASVKIVCKLTWTGESNFDVVPLAAQAKFFSWLKSSRFLEQSPLKMLARLTGGHTESVSDQLSCAMKEDDTLFVEEEQNLFTDEVREMNIWAQILHDADEVVVDTMISWVLDGLTALERVTINQGQDGPRGWTTNPRVFAICMRVIVNGNALLTHCEKRLSNVGGDIRLLNARDAIMAAFGRLRDVGIEHSLHDSILRKIPC